MRREKLAAILGYFAGLLLIPFGVVYGLRAILLFDSDDPLLGYQRLWLAALILICGFSWARPARLPRW